MKRIKCEKILLNFLDKYSGWHKKVDLMKVAEEFSPETTGRVLRALAEKNIIKKEFYDGKYAKGLVMYASLETKESRVEIVEVDGRRVAVLKEYK